MLDGALEMPLYGSAIPSFYQGLDQAQQRARYQQLIDQQKQQQAGLSALANAYAAPPPAPPMPPPPGAQSQPMQPPPGQGMPQPPQGMPPQRPPMMPPGQMPGRQMGPPQQQMGPPPQGQQQMPPYTAPKAPPQPQQAPPQSIQPPPQGQDPSQGMPPPPPKIQEAIQSALPNLHDMASKLQEQGITGMPLYYALMQHQQMLSTEGKQQLAELNLMLRKEQADSAGLRAQVAGQDANRKGRAEDRLEGAAPDAKKGLRDSQIDLNEAKAAKTRLNASGGGGSSSAGDVDLVAQAVAAGKVDPKSLSTKGGLREKVLEKALKINPEYDMKNYAADNAFETSGMRTAGAAGANTAIAAGAAQGGADIMMDAASKVPRGEWRSLNKAIIAGKTEANDPATGAFLTSINTFVNEYARSINPKGTATVSDKEHARELLAASDSQDAFAAKVAVMRKEMDRGRQAPQDVAQELRKNRNTAPGQPRPSASDIAYVKAHPEMKAQFKAHFGIDP